ncbi:transposase [Microbulbifer sp. DLAB2-AA]|uniref:transposase n=1 Tax=Microbulbifer sp. DLAB2-AA TaxID=3243394 RepID=UPI00403A2DD5
MIRPVSVSGFKSELTDAQWKLVEPCLPQLKRGKGGPKPIDNRACFEGILWILRSGARWKDLPPSYPSPSLAEEGSSFGKSKALGWRLGENFSDSSIKDPCLIGKKSFRIVALLQQKKGSRSRKN